MASQEFWNSPVHEALLAESQKLKTTTIKSLLESDARNKDMIVESEGIVFDFTRQKVDTTTLQSLLAFAEARGVKTKIAAMFAGEKINETEHRAVLHTALRCGSHDTFMVDGHSVVDEVYNVLNAIEAFSNDVRSGTWKGYTGKQLKDVICIGIGGSYLGPEFVVEAMRTHKECASACAGRRLRFLANVDPIDVARATEGFDPESTLIIVVSKTFTTAETMLNARTLRAWLLSTLKAPEAVASHMVAVSTNIAEARKFGIDEKNVFGFWDWVGGRFSVCSAVGCLPLALHFGFKHVRQFLDGCRAMDLHFRDQPFQGNLPVLAGLISFWNTTYLGLSDVAVLPYCQALHRFAAHIQQLTMESNGKGVTLRGTPFPESYQTGEFFFGEPGTNGQHSFYQLLHQGRTAQSEFIGFIRSQNPIQLEGELVSNHDELMSNFFAQPDALALGKTAEQCKAEGVPDALLPHKIFKGDRPSILLLLPECDPFNIGRLLALYEHRTAVQGFLWGLNSFDQWGVELGKQLAKNVRHVLHAKRTHKDAALLENQLPKPTRYLLQKYLEG